VFALNVFAPNVFKKTAIKKMSVFDRPSTLKRMNELADLAESMYASLLTDLNKDPQLRKIQRPPSPSDFLVNQTWWTKNYMDYDAINMANPFYDIMRRNSFDIYMAFMINNYPKGFDTAIKKCFLEQVPFDSAHQFWALSRPCT